MLEQSPYSIRVLQKDDWRIFADVRLEALQSHPGLFGSTYARESRYGPEDWQEWLLGGGKCLFGLFDGDKMIGITGIITDAKQQETGMFIASYIKPAYRDKGLSDLLYRARIEWAKEYVPWKRLVVGHRDGNEPSRRANQRHGFRHTHTETRDWPDGSTADELMYELDLNELRQKA